MARLPRFGVPGYPQHVIQRGNNKSPLFTSPDDFLFFKYFLGSALRRSSCQLHAYVLMTNHVHFLISQDKAGSIGKLMQSVGGRYVRYFNDCRGRSGTLWEGRYRATIVNTDEYLFRCYRYVEENPVRARMVKSPREYQWSSFAANASGSPDTLVTPHELYFALGVTSADRQRHYRSLFRDPIERSTLAAIRDATNHGWALGNSRFQRAVDRERRAGRMLPSRCPIHCQIA
jgi:putative transposase